MMKIYKYIVLIYCGLQCVLSFGQQQLSVNFKANFGKTGLKFDGSPNQLKDISHAINTISMFGGIEYKIGRYIGIGLHVFDQKYNWKFTDNQTISLSNGDYIKMSAQSASEIQGFSGNLNFYYPIKGGDKANWTLATGYNLGKTKPIGGLIVNDYSNPELLFIQVKESAEISSAFIETGISLKLGKHTAWKTHLGYNYAFNDILDCSYNLQTNSNQANILIKLHPGSIYFGSSLSYSFITFKKRLKKKRYQPEYNEKEEVVAINGRKVYPSHRIDVHSRNIEIEVWDYGRKDGDKISLYLNDQKVLKKYKLTKKKKKIELRLKNGMNKLIVYAHNLGKDPPNTASVVIYEGDQKHNLSLESTLGECGAVEIYYEP